MESVTTGEMHWFSVPGYDPATAPHVDFDERGRAYLMDAHRRDAVGYWEAKCPKEYRSFNASHDTILANADAINRVLSWTYGRKGLLLSGPTGRGKTRTCWELIRRLAQHSVRVKAWHAQDFFSELAKQVKYGRDDAGGWVSDQAWNTTVFIDDWGQQANTKSQEEWAEGWWFRFLDLRIERGLPLIITTNLTAKDIAHRTTDVRSDPMLRRLLELCDVVKFT